MATAGTPTAGPPCTLNTSPPGASGQAHTLTARALDLTPHLVEHTSSHTRTRVQAPSPHLQAIAVSPSPSLLSISLSYQNKTKNEGKERRTMRAGRGSMLTESVLSVPSHVTTCRLPCVARIQDKRSGVISGP